MKLYIELLVSASVAKIYCCFFVPDGFGKGIYHCSVQNKGIRLFQSNDIHLFFSRTIL